MDRTTIKDIASRAGVSITTVSLVLNGKEHRIAQETKKKIINIANELDYRPNQLAIGLITKRTNTIGLIVPDISNTFFGELAKGAEKKAAEKNFNIILCNTNDTASKDYEYLNVLLDRGVDGIILVPSGRGRDETIPKCFTLLEQCQKPFVLADRIKVGDKYSGVTLDQEQGGFIATNHLIQNGHKKIGCITGPLGMLNAYLRYQGYRKAIEEAGIEYHPKWVREGNYHIEDGVELSKALFQEGVTAIFACNDLMAYGVYQSAVRAGIKVPEELSIVGFDDIIFSQFSEVPLTTIHQPTYQMGETAVQKLLALIMDKEEKNEKIVFKPELIIRNSVKAIQV
ncbi:LacI family DNA-binding transcriptional regulator [Eisenbergiella porci]|uniref:LacI family DNA-binding transcriptional regulator n=1 Tax=Eisenbergiella porci TaxID=2652274 RepID=UPI002A80A63A|nr:LacI family DNA-binding transcriptional regulator [Eisenbergiella porci]